MRKFKVVDMFAGAGGFSTGALQACNRLGRGIDLTAINHWGKAVESHAANHPAARHLCKNVDSVDPRQTCGSKIDMLIASPECTHHSRARGGKPINDQSRASAWHVVHWAESLRPDVLLIENVKEFTTWSPLNRHGKPIASRKGEIYQAFLQTLRAIGYTLSELVLTAADYGDPTIRQRLFIMGVRGNVQVPHPVATNSKIANGLPGWVPARNIIDWQRPSQSIFTRPRPLKETTLRRIEAGLRKFGGAAAEPFLVMMRGTSPEQVAGSGRSVDEPLPTVTAGGIHAGLVQPCIIQMEHGQQRLRSHSVDAPMPTVTSADGFGLVQPFIMPTNHGADTRTHSIDEPMRTVTSVDAWGVVEPFILPQFGGSAPRSIDSPLGTITTTSRGVGLVQPFLAVYNGHGHSAPVDRPLDTVTTRDRFGLVSPVDGVRRDILFRMLQPYELAAAMSFPQNYIFKGTREDQVKMIGNAVAVRTAEALCYSLLSFHQRHFRDRRVA